MTGTRPEKSPEPPFSVRLPFLIGVEGVTRVTFVRHGQQDYPTDAVHRPEDWEDPVLSKLGHVQAAAVGSALAEEDVDVVVCSTMRRAMQTAEAVAAPHELTPIVIDAIREVASYRDLEPGVDPKAVVDPEEWKQRELRFYFERRWDHMPFSESSAEFRARVLPALDAVLEQYAGKHVVFVTHGGVINAFFAAILGLDEDLFFLPNHCSISRAVVKDPIRRMKTINEHAHLHLGILTD